MVNKNILKDGTSCICRCHWWLKSLAPCITAPIHPDQSAQPVTRSPCLPSFRFLFPMSRCPNACLATVLAVRTLLAPQEPHEPIAVGELGSCDSTWPFSDQKLHTLCIHFSVTVEFRAQTPRVPKTDCDCEAEKVVAWKSVTPPHTWSHVEQFLSDSSCNCLDCWDGWETNATHMVMLEAMPDWHHQPGWLEKNLVKCHYMSLSNLTWLVDPCFSRFRPCGWQKNYRSRRIYRKGHNSWQEVAAGTILWHLWHCKICQEQPKVLISSLRIGWVSRIQRLKKAMPWCKVLLDCAGLFFFAVDSSSQWKRGNCNSQRRKGYIERAKKTTKNDKTWWKRYPPYMHLKRHLLLPSSHCARCPLRSPCFLIRKSSRGAALQAQRLFFPFINFLSSGAIVAQGLKLLSFCGANKRATETNYVESNHQFSLIHNVHTFNYILLHDVSLHLMEAGSWGHHPMRQLNVE